MPASLFYYGPLVKRLRQRPLTPLTWVRFPHGSPKSTTSFEVVLFSLYALFNRCRAYKVTRVGIEKPGPRVQRTAGQKQPRGLFLGRGRFPHGRKLMWPGWLVGARVARVSTAAFGSVRAGHARPLPGGEKGRVSGRGKVRRRGQDPSLRCKPGKYAMQR